MRLESVRALKQEVVERLIAPAIEYASWVRAFSTSALSVTRSGGPPAVTALGVAAGAGRGDYRLAVRLQSRPIEADVALRDRLEIMAHQELDIRYIGRVTKLAAPRTVARQRPLLIGASVGHFAVTAGTIGAFPIHRKSGKRVILSNNHILANEGLTEVGDVIVQPGTLDGGSKAAGAVAALLYFTPLTLDGANVIDAAIASLDADVGADQHLLTGFGAHAGPRPSPIDVGEEVIKVGRTSGLTRGKVSAIEFDDVVADYEMGSLRFDRQTEIEGDGDHPFSQGGDSGSIVIDQAGHAFGFVFAGTDQGGSNGKGLTYANDLGLVLSILDLTLDI